MFIRFINRFVLIKRYESHITKSASTGKRRTFAGGMDLGSGLCIHIIKEV